MRVTGGDGRMLTVAARARLAVGVLLLSQMAL